MKKTMTMLITVIIETGLTWLIANYFEVRFIEVMFFTGLAFATLIFWFTSSGGILTRAMNSQTSAQTGLLIKNEYSRFEIHPAFAASLIFLLIGLIFFILLLKGIIPSAT